MSVSIRIAGAAFTKYVAVGPPFALDDAKSYFLLGGDEAASKSNLVGNKLPATVIGAPTYASNYATLSQVNGFESADAASNSPFTHIYVGEYISGFATYCGDWDQATNNANLLYRNSDNTVTCAVSGSPKASLAEDSVGFRLRAASYDGATAKVYSGDSGVLTSASASSTLTASPQKFRIGGHGFSTGVHRAAAAITFDRVLTDSEITDIYDYLTGILAARGITIE
jgi:hypothetical protein